MARTLSRAYNVSPTACRTATELGFTALGLTTTQRLTLRCDWHIDFAVFTSPNRQDVNTDVPVLFISPTEAMYYLV
ncbi:hypothetical protein NDU88_003026 [Pleurodeles waltl]|uniref:Uncharacterized protein n=1 Tax=Pleurodeles waltl TaxID=8319 RepID=A0AAV7WRW5_PLEWA|nr:hypothetical protein NDU88_003026 [Pleurodeles waltl]